MADIHFEIFDNADFGNKNLRFSDAPAQEQRDFLKQNGYGFTTRYGGVWYPRTKEAKDRNADFVKEFAEKFYPENKKTSSLIRLSSLRNRHWKTVQLKSRLRLITESHILKILLLS